MDSGYYAAAAGMIEKSLPAEHVISAQPGHKGSGRRGIAAGARATQVSRNLCQ